MSMRWQPHSKKAVCVEQRDTGGSSFRDGPESSPLRLMTNTTKRVPAACYTPVRHLGSRVLCIVYRCSAGGKHRRARMCDMQAVSRSGFTIFDSRERSSSLFFAPLLCVSGAGMCVTTRARLTHTMMHEPRPVVGPCSRAVVVPHSRKRKRDQQPTILHLTYTPIWTLLGKKPDRFMYVDARKNPLLFFRCWKEMLFRLWERRREAVSTNRPGHLSSLEGPLRAGDTHSTACCPGQEQCTLSVFG